VQRRLQAITGRLPFLILLGGSAKLLVDTTVQLYNPFLAVIAAGAGVSIVAMGRIVAARSVMGLVAPALGALADRIGYRAVMRGSLFLLGIAMIVAAFTGSVVVFAGAVVLTGIGQSGYTPNLHAYLSAKLPYEKRAKGLGVIEYSWALAGIVGLFLSGHLIEAYSWRAPFLVIGCAVVVMAVAFSLLPRASTDGKRPAGPVAQTAPTAQTAPAGHAPPAERVATGVGAAERENGGATSPKRSLIARARGFFVLGNHAGSAWAAIALSGLNMFAMIHVMIIHGGWLQAEYSLSPALLGTVALIFGLTDLTASVSVSLFVDRIGKRRSVTIGVVGMCVGFVVLPFLNLSLPLAVLSIALPRICFEFAVVSNFPLLSEQAPHARGKVMSLGITAALIGATLAGLTGPAAYLRYGVWGLGPVSAVAATASLLLLVFFVRERPYAQPDTDATTDDAATGA
jgi:predicted MFS family arabinose efflux permease